MIFHRNKQLKQTKAWIFYFYLIRQAFKGTFVNRALPSVHEESLEIMLTDHLICFIFQAALVRIPIHADMMEDPIQTLPVFRNETSFKLWIFANYKESATGFKVISLSK